MSLKAGMQILVLEYYQIPSSDDPGLTLTYLTVRSNLVPHAFIDEKVKKTDFLETTCIVVYDIKVGRWSQLNEYVKLYEYQKSSQSQCDSEGWIFLSAPNNHGRFFFLHTFWSPALDFNVGVAINKSLDVHHIESWRRMWHRNDINSQRLNNIVTWPPIQPMYWQHVLLFAFIYPTGRIRVCKKRFVTSVENRGKPCLVCKSIRIFNGCEVQTENSVTCKCSASLSSYLWCRCQKLTS